MVREHPTLSSGYSQTSGVPPDNPQEQVLRGPAGEEAVGGQQGVLQPKVPQPMNVNSTTSSLLPPAKLQQQVLWVKPQAEYGDTGLVQIFVLTISVRNDQYLSG